jgi:hypothetical protein
MVICDDLDSEVISNLSIEILDAFLESQSVSIQSYSVSMSRSRREFYFGSPVRYSREIDLVQSESSDLPFDFKFADHFGITSNPLVVPTKTIHFWMSSEFGMILKQIVFRTDIQMCE